MVLSAAPAPMAHHQLLVFLSALTVLLLLARLLGGLAERLGMPAVVGELLTGVILGPSLLGHLTPGITGWLLPDDPGQMHLLDAVAQLGLLLLVGITGTHVDVTVLRRHRRAATAVSACGLLIPLALGIGLGLLIPASVSATPAAQRWTFALLIGVAICVSAVPVIAKTLSDMRLLHRDIGQLTLAVSVIDDVAGWLLLSLVATAATVGLTVGAVSLSVAYLLGFVAFAATVGRFLVRRVMKRVARSGEPGPAVAAAVVIVLVGAVITHSLRMEALFGALVAGVLIATTRSAQVLLAPLRAIVLSVLAPIFLATAGLRMDLTALAEPAVTLTGLAVLAVAIVGKFTGAFVGAWLGRLDRWSAMALGAGMNARGVIQVIVALTGLRLGVLNTAMYTVVVLVAIVTSLMTPPLLRYATNRMAEGETERLRRLEHDTWQGRSPATAVTPTATPDP
ncbi:cation:proton antiporter [Micromonospora sp. ALFpr18c]|uniref:cation:proton antiporter n=1 Tax=unclassified Micromonospora TaxID=2617518 RepID=UPI00124BA766|nr:cation:proton antiporter [Micromonospora sp. ALFpr18c]KAB1947324.1 cation:proton antiporter [Micromonospora sp. ALFpr18c]